MLNLYHTCQTPLPLGALAASAAAWRAGGAKRTQTPGRRRAAPDPFCALRCIQKCPSLAFPAYAGVSPLHVKCDAHSSLGAGHSGAIGNTKQAHRIPAGGFKMISGGDSLVPFPSSPGSPHGAADLRQKWKNYLLLRKNPYVILKKREDVGVVEKPPAGRL